MTGCRSPAMAWTAIIAGSAPSGESRERLRSLDLPQDSARRAHEAQPGGQFAREPYVYDSVARDLKRLALEGLVEIIDEKASGDGGERLIERIAFRRLR